MKNILIKVIFVMFLIISPAYAVTFDVLVLPADLFNTKENYYYFDEPSEIFANDIISSFNATNGKIKSPLLPEIRAGFNKNQELKKETDNALKQFKNKNKIDYQLFKKAGENFDCKSVLIISSSVKTNQNTPKRSIWEVLEITSAFDITYPYKLETSIVLLDTVNDLVMWSNNFTARIGDNTNNFNAKNYAQANEKLEKIKLYSKNIIAPSVSQNITLRFFPKTIRPVKENFENTGGNPLRFEKNIPEKPKSDKSQKEEFYGDMIYEF